MRFEGKHNFFKDIAHRIKCFRNIPKSMAENHQLYSCYLRNSQCSKMGKDAQTGPGKVGLYTLSTSNTSFIVAIKLVSQLKYKDSLLARFSSMSNETSVNRFAISKIALLTDRKRLM